MFCTHRSVPNCYKCSQFKMPPYPWRPPQTLQYQRRWKLANGYNDVCVYCGQPPIDPVHALSLHQRLLVRSLGKKKLKQQRAATGKTGFVVRRLIDLILNGRFQCRTSRELAVFTLCNQAKHGTTQKKRRVHVAHEHGEFVCASIGGTCASVPFGRQCMAAADAAEATQSRSNRYLRLPENRWAGAVAVSSRSL